MRSRLRWPVLLAAAALLLAACSQGSDELSTAAQAPAATTSCASNGELVMWERSGGNKQMVDMLVAAWNQKNPNCKVKLTYIPHTEMVGKIAQGIASGEVPDLMGMDLIYAPQFEKAQQLVDLTDRIGTWPSPPSRTGSTGSRCTPTCRPSSTTRTSSRGPGSTPTSRRPAWPSCAPTPTRSPPSGATPRATTCR